MSATPLTQKRLLVFKQFNWRAMLVRILVNALTLIITVLIIPSISFVAPISAWRILLLAVALGFLNALIKPIIQFLTLSYIFATYGLVVIFINTIILYSLAWMLPGYFDVGNFIWAFVGGAVMGIIAGFLESMFGLTIPIVDEDSVSEPMRRAAEMNKRRQQAFPFNEVQGGASEISSTPSLSQFDQSDSVVAIDETEKAPISEEKSVNSIPLEAPGKEPPPSPEQEDSHPVKDEIEDAAWPQDSSEPGGGA